MVTVVGTAPRDEVVAGFEPRRNIPAFRVPLRLVTQAPISGIVLRSPEVHANALLGLTVVAHEVCPGRRAGGVHGEVAIDAAGTVRLDERFVVAGKRGTQRRLNGRPVRRPPGTPLRCPQPQGPGQGLDRVGGGRHAPIGLAFRTCPPRDTHGEDSAGPPYGPPRGTIFRCTHRSSASVNRRCVAQPCRRSAGGAAVVVRSVSRGRRSDSHRDPPGRDGAWPHGQGSLESALTRR
jgi:hypothetical protein